MADDAPVNECYLLFYKKCSCVCLNHSSFPAILCRGRFIVFGLTYLNLQMEHEISPEKQAALDAAQKLRDKAGEEAKLRGECFEKSKKEFESGDKGKAKELSEEGHKHDEQMKKYNKEAADAFFAAHNKGRDQMTIDLHGLYVEEAMERLKARVEAIGRKGTFIIIWGAGNHSEGGVRKIKPAVIDYLNAEKFKFEDDNPNHGCCTVFFDGKEAAAAVEPKKEVPAATETKKEVPAPSTGKKGTLPVTQTEETKKACCACCCVM